MAGSCCKLRNTNRFEPDCVADTLSSAQSPFDAKEGDSGEWSVPAEGTSIEVLFA